MRAQGKRSDWEGDRRGARKPQPIRNALFSHIGRLLLDDAHPPRAAERAALVDALGLLLPGINIEKRQRLAEGVNRAAHPPRRLLSMLARDDIAVARILLEGNPRLGQADLKTIARTGTPSHRLAMARRSDMTAPVVDALVEHGDARVIEALASNDAAAFSLKSLARLAADFRHLAPVEAFLDHTLGANSKSKPKAEVKAEVQEPVGQRVKLPPPAPRPPPPGATRLPRVEQAAIAGVATGPSPAATTIWSRRAAPEDIDRIVVKPGAAPPPASDKTRQKAALAEVARSVDISRAVADWTWECDRRGHLTALSDGAVNAFGVPSPAVLGSEFGDLGAFMPVAGRGRDILGAMTARRPFRGAPFLARSRTAGDTSWLLSGVPVFDISGGRFGGFRGAATGVTAPPGQVRGRIQGEVRGRVQGADRAPARDSAQDNLARDRAVAAQAERLAGLSHEFRTPLNAIIGFSDVIAMTTAGTAESKYSAPAQAIRDAAWGLNSFVSDLLDTASMEAGALTLEVKPLELHAVLADAVQAAGEAAEARDITLRQAPFSSDIKVMGHLGRCDQIIGKILGHAIEQAPPGSETLIDAAGGGRMVRIGVTCKAPMPTGGNPDDLFLKVLEPEPGGKGGPRIAPGFALAFARDLARLMGGELSARGIDGGLRFCLELPSA